MQTLGASNASSLLCDCAAAGLCLQRSQEAEAVAQAALTSASEELKTLGNDALDKARALHFAPWLCMHAVDSVMLQHGMIDVSVCVCALFRR